MNRHALASVSLILLSLAAVPHATAGQGLRDAIQQRRQAREGAVLPAGTRIERDIAYGSDARQRYDVYLPPRTAARAPILVMVHGGGWRTGDKANPGVAGDKAAYWLAKGFVFVSVNNRLLPEADPLQQAADVAAAVASVQARAAQWNADPRKLVLMGHSAGAHLVALLGASPERLARAGALRPLGVVSLDSAALDVPALMAKPRVPRLYKDAFGTEPASWMAASPYHQLGRQALPVLLVCSSQRLDSCRKSRAFARKAHDLGVPTQVLPEDLGHGEINKQLGQPSAYTRDVAAWIDHLAR